MFKKLTDATQLTGATGNDPILPPPALTSTQQPPIRHKPSVAYSQATEPVALSGSHRGTRYLAYYLQMQMDDFPYGQIARMLPSRSGVRMMLRLVWFDQEIEGENV